MEIQKGPFLDYYAASNISFNIYVYEKFIVGITLIEPMSKR